jgi:hypothetical protein
MTGSGERLVPRLRAAGGALYFAAVAAAAWPEARLRLELAGAEYAALPLLDAGWGVLTPDPRGIRTPDVSGCREGMLAGYLAARGAAGIALYEGWAAAACRGTPTAACAVGAALASRPSA